MAVNISIYKPSQKILDKLEGYRSKGNKVNVKAITNRDKAQIQCQIADLELLLHYIGTRQLFVQEVQ